MSSRLSRNPERPVRRFDPCLPRPAKQPPAGPGWIHEIKHDGFRILAHRDGDRVRLITRNGFDFADRFTLIVEAIAALPVRSCVLDGEAIAVDADGLSVFDLIRYRQHDRTVTLCAFDLLELDGEDLRRTPLELRKATLKGLLRRGHAGVAFNQHSVEGRSSSSRPARSAARASCRSGLARPIAPAGSIIGSRSRTRRRRR